MSQKFTILITGGCGYIGSHTVVELINNGYNVVIVDNLSNSHIKVIDRIKKITGVSDIPFYQINILDLNALETVFYQHKINAIIHFAAFKAVGESVLKPLEYYKNNVSGSIGLLSMMQKFDISTLIFSSSATVYGDPKQVPITEDFDLSATNPYGWSKLMSEQIMRDFAISNNKINIGLLRYFNPVGAHKSGLIGEDPNGIPNNLMPYIAQVAVGKLQQLSIFGNDYNTHDGTGVRDYIHVVDLAIGHIKALEYFILQSNIPNNILTLNLGTGIGYSVLDVVKAFEQSSGKKIDYKIAPRRLGDIAKCYANPSKAKALLNWQTHKTLIDMCTDTWNWQQLNPNGYCE